MAITMALVASAPVVHTFARAIAGAADGLVVILIDGVLVWILRIDV